MADQLRLALGADALDGTQLALDAVFAAQGPVVGDAEAVSLIADVLHQMQGVGAPVQHDGVGLSGQVDFFKSLGQAEHRHAGSRFFHGPVGEQKLLRAAVDEHHVRQGGEASARPGQALLLPLVLFLQAVGEAPPDDFRHGGKVVGSLHGLDTEVTVFLFGGHAALEHHHAGHA